MLSFFHPFLSKVTHDDEYRDQQSARDADSNDQHFFAVFIFRVEEKRNFLFTNGTTEHADRVAKQLGIRDLFDDRLFPFSDVAQRAPEVGINTLR